MNATFIPSGIDRPAHIALLASEQATGKINARYALQPVLHQAYSTQWPSTPLVLDCGSFQPGERDVVAYAALLEQIGKRFLWISNLDAPLQPQVGAKHFAYLQSHLPSALAAKILWIYQPGGSLADVEYFARERGMIGIGGLVKVLKQHGVDGVLHLLNVIGERLNRVGGRAHLFGVSSPQVLFRVRSEPWLASVDSSKWLVAYRAAQVLRTSGTGQCRAEQLELCFTPQEMAANNIRVLRRWVTSAGPVQLSFFGEEDEALDPVTMVPYEDMFPFTVLLRSPSTEALLARFLKRFPHVFDSWDGSDEDDEIFVRLIAPLSFEEHLIAWCEEVQRIRQLTSYDVWCEEEAISV